MDCFKFERQGQFLNFDVTLQSPTNVGKIQKFKVERATQTKGTHTFGGGFIDLSSILLNLLMKIDDIFLLGKQLF